MRIFKSKKRVLIYGDYNCTTGFSTVVTNILRQLQKYFAGQVHFDVVATNWYGDKLPDDYVVKKEEAVNIKTVEEFIDGELKKVKKRIIKNEGKDTVVYSAYYNDDSKDALSQKDPFGRNGMLSMLKHMEYHLLFAIQDIGNMADVFQVIRTIKQEKKLAGRKQTKVMYYMPLDGGMIPSWFDHFDAVDRLIAYTEFAKKEALLVRPYLKMSVILHGINTAEFGPLPDGIKKEFRRSYFGEHADKFIISNINRNQHRKDIPSTIFAFKYFKDNIDPDSFLYLHMDPEDIQGWNLKVLMDQTGLKNNEDYMFTPPDLIANPPDAGFMNCIYNASDVYLTTTTGEGFGLTILEAMMARVPVVAPFNTSIKEISGISEVTEAVIIGQIINSSRLLSYQSNMPYVSRFDNMIRTRADMVSLVQRLQVVYHTWKRTGVERIQLDEMLDKANLYARELNWNNIGKLWIDEFKKLL